MTASNTPATPDKQQRLRGFALASVMIALMLSLLLEAMDQTIVGTAMPRIIAELHGLDRYTWVVTAYVLASMMTIPLVGKLSDQFGRKWFLLMGTAVFLLGSLLAGASQTMNRLIIFRALQGLGAGCHRHRGPVRAGRASQVDEPFWHGLWRLESDRTNHWRLAG